MLTRAKFVPHDYQEIALDFMDKHPKSLLILDMGLGKTVITLTSLQDGIKRGKYKRPLIIAPKIVSENTWATEIFKWQHLKYLKYVEIDSTNTKKRLEQYDRITDGTLTIISESKIQWLVDMYAAEAMKEDGREWQFDCIVIDEISLFKNPNSNRFKNLQKKVQNKCKHVIGLTGTPAPNSLADLWAIMKLIDNGQRLGKTKRDFNRAFCDEKKIKINSGDNQQYIKTYDVRDDMYNAILEAIDDIAIAMLASDHLVNYKLPKYKRHTVQLSKQTSDLLTDFIAKKAISIMEGADDSKAQRRAAKLRHRIKKLNNKHTIEAQIKAQTLAAKLEKIERDNGAVSISTDHIFAFINMQRQLTGGAIYEQLELEGLDEEEINNRMKDRKTIELHDEKMTELDRIIKEADDNVFIFVSYRHEADRIRKRYGKRVEFLNTANAQQILPRWNAGEIPILVANPASTKFGLNMQNGGHTIVWYSMGYSFEAFVQSNARLARQGQKSEVVVHILGTELADGAPTIEGYIQGAINEKRELNDGVYDFLGSGQKTQYNGQDARVVAKKAAKNQLEKIIGRRVVIED